MQREQYEHYFEYGNKHLTFCTTLYSVILLGASLTTIIAVAAAGAGVILIFLAVSLLCCYCKKRNRYEGSPTNPRSVSPTPSACQSPSRPSSAAPTLVMVQSIAAADLPSIRRPIPVMALPVEQDSYMYPAHSPDRAAVRETSPTNY